MKENALDVLMYLFENYMIEDTGFRKDHETLTAELSQAGFEHGEIDKAFNWLQDLSEMCDPDYSPPTHISEGSVRQFAPEEIAKLDKEIRGFLLSLEQAKVLDPQTREVVIDRIMALDSEEVDLDQVKWVTMMVLCNQPGREDICAWAEDLILDGVGAHLH